MKKRDTGRRWTSEQDQVIVDLYPKIGAAAVAKKLGLCYDSVQLRAKKLLGLGDCRVRWTEEKLVVLRDRYAADGPAKVAKAIGMSYWAVVGQAAKQGVKRTRSLPIAFEWTEEAIDQVRRRYVAEGGKPLAAEFGIPIDRVRKKAVELGLHTIAGHAAWGKERAEGNSNCDVHYFDTWSPDMAYVLGFTFADGCVNKNLGSFGYCLSVKDVAVLEYIKAQLKSNHRIRITPPGYYSGAWSNGGAWFTVGSTVLVRRLVELGVHPRKTYRNDPFPAVPDDMMPHFVRGYLDGDGSVSRGGGLGFTGSPKFIKGLRDALVRLAGMQWKRTVTYCSGTPYSDVHWGADEDLRKFRSFAYPDGFAFCYQRKKTRLDNWLDRPNRKLTKGYRRFTPAEEQLIREQYHVLGPTKLARQLGRDRVVVHWKVKQLGLEPFSRRRT